MINLLPEPKLLQEKEGSTKIFNSFCLCTPEGADPEELRELAALRFWNRKDISFAVGRDEEEKALKLKLEPSLEGIDTPKPDLFKEQGYDLTIEPDCITLRYESSTGYVYALTSVKLLLEKAEGGYTLPLLHITDYPSLPVRAIAQTFSWYAGYGRFGFDSQLWGYDEWEEYLNICLDNKINQFNLVMYGYWPFEFEEYYY